MLFRLNQEELTARWHADQDCLVTTLDSLQHEDLQKDVFVSNMGHSVVVAINR